MNPDLTAVDALKAEWDALQPLSAENSARLWKKLRLEWNYNSNHIEGNTLTYGETELLLIHDRTTGDHQLRDYEEMKAHDVGIAHIKNLSEEKDRMLTEADIRDLNKIILKEPFWKEAITMDGQATRKQVIPGEYKTTPNNVRTATGEIFAFASPTDTPVRMHELVGFLRRESDAHGLHAVELVAKLHHDFVLIHPFDDGNGRVARLLMNYVLLRLGYPPVIIKAEDKSSYLAALRKADAGDFSAFATYLSAQLERSLSLGIQAAKGESVDEPSDVEKELAIFIRDQQTNQDRVKLRSPEVLKELSDLSWKRLFDKFEEKISKLYPLFADHILTVSPQLQSAGGSLHASLEAFVKGRASQFQVIVNLRGYRGKANNPFDLQAELRLNLTDFEYQVIALGSVVSKKLYSQPILVDEAELIATNALKRLFEDIKRQSLQT